MSVFRRKSQKEIHDFSFFRLVSNTAELTETGEVFDRISVDHIGAVAVVPILDNGDIVLISQYRATVDDYCLEAVAGRRDVDGEEPSACALRELEEEVGVKASEIKDLGWIYTSPGYSNERLFLFVGLKCEEPSLPNPVGIEEKYSEVVRCSFEQAFEWINQGKITDAKSIIAIERAHKHLT